MALAWLTTIGCIRRPLAEEVPNQATSHRTARSHSSQIESSRSANPNATDSSSPAIRWQFQAGEAFEATPVHADGRVIIADVMGKIYAIDHSNGKELWNVDYDTGFLAAAVIRDGSIMIGDVEGNLYCLSADDGHEQWQVETGGEISGSVALHHGNVMVASQDGILYCFKRSDGSPVWKYQTDDQIRCSPCIAGDRTFLGGCDGRLHAVNLLTGRAASEPMPLGGPTGSTPAVHDSIVVVPIMDGIVYAFDWKNQKQLWYHEDEERPQEYRSSPAIAGDLVILSSQFKQVDAISIKTGKRVWRHTLRRRADASPVIAGDDVWIASTDGRLIRLDLATGEPREWSYEGPGGFYAAPLVVGNELLIADDKGIVRCFTGLNESVLASGPE